MLCREDAQFLCRRQKFARGTALRLPIVTRGAERVIKENSANTDSKAKDHQSLLGGNFIEAGVRNGLTYAAEAIL